MAKRKMTPLALVLTLIDGLSPDEITTLADFLRGKIPQTPRKSGKKKALIHIPLCAVPNCGASEDFKIHNPASPEYHLFRTAVKTKGASG